MEQQTKFNIGDKVCFVGVVLDAEYEYDTVSAVILTNGEVQYDVSDKGDLSCLFYESELVPYEHKESIEKVMQRKKEVA